MIRHWEDAGTGRGGLDWTLWRWLNVIAWAHLYDIEFE